MTTSFISFSLFALVVTMAPGPDTLLVLRNCMRGGRLPGVSTALGAAAGSLAWAVVAAVGLAAVLQRWDMAFTVVRLAGAAYLVFLGVQSLWAYRRGATGRPEMPGESPGLTPAAGRAFRQGLLSCLLNPKVGIFFVSVVPQFLPNGHGTFAATLTFGVIDAGIAAGWLMLVTVFAARMLTWLRRPRVNTAMERTAAGVLVVLGIGTAAESV
ncbi:LysE family translocator [Streptomyces sp. 769]|uniref:LysE family translocator n=1 Tax=Streptomyces sp. 769 TaxID=1262452 RepID=UPI000580126A|nr:LysE family translocator [Streptomyces sp. 769]AJC53906.1 LysE family translocator protein [Streptomyces sp. 769]